MLRGGFNLEEYKNLYITIFNGISDAIEMLKQLQTEVEKRFMEQADSENDQIT